MNWHKDGELNGLWLLSNSEIWCQIMRVINNRRKFLLLDTVTWYINSKSLGEYPQESDFLTAINNSTEQKNHLFTLYKTILAQFLIIRNYKNASSVKLWKKNDWTDLETYVLSTNIDKWWNIDTIIEIRTELDKLVYAEKLDCTVEEIDYSGAKHRKILSDNKLSVQASQFIAERLGEPYTSQYDSFCYVEERSGTFTSNFNIINTDGSLVTSGVVENPYDGFEIGYFNNFIPPFANKFRNNYNKLVNMDDTEDAIRSFGVFAPLTRTISLFEAFSSPLYFRNYRGFKFICFPDGATFHKLKYNDSKEYKVTFDALFPSVMDSLFFAIALRQDSGGTFYSNDKVTNFMPEGLISPYIFSAGMTSHLNDTTAIPNGLTGLDYSIDLNTSIYKRPEILFLIDYSYKTDYNNWVRIYNDPFGIYKELQPNYNAYTGASVSGNDINFSFDPEILGPVAIRASSTPNDSATILP